MDYTICEISQIVMECTLCEISQIVIECTLCEISQIKIHIHFILVFKVTSLALSDPMSDLV
jgi:hypothetical protein